MRIAVFFSLLLAGCAATKVSSFHKLHEQSVVVDTHNDFPSASIEKQLQFDKDQSGKAHSDLYRMIRGGVDVQIFSVWCDGEQQHPFDYANRQIDSVYAWVRRNPASMQLVTTPEELTAAVRKKQLAAMLGVEGGHMIENSLEKLEALHRRGVSYLTITHNNSTGWATSAKDETGDDALPAKGLNDFGKRVIQRMNDLGMLIDVSHAGEQTFWDIINTTTKPVIASHSSVDALYPHRRNLKDDQIRAIAKNGGVIHVNFYAGFIDSTYARKIEQFKARHQQEVREISAKNNVQSEYAWFVLAEKYKEEIDTYRPPLSVLIDHIDYIVKLVGADHAGLGSDFDGIEALPLQLNGVQDFPVITEALLARGYQEKDIKKILGGNFIRVLKANKPK